VPFKKGVYQGNKNANSRLTEGQVVIIKRDLALGVPAPALARLHQVSAETIRRIGRGETWGWLGDGVNQPEVELNLGREPSKEEIAASLARLHEKLKNG
jgi:hypothetical protein